MNYEKNRFDAGYLYPRFAHDCSATGTSYPQGANGRAVDTRNGSVRSVSGRYQITGSDVDERWRLRGYVCVDGVAATCRGN